MKTRTQVDPDANVEDVPEVANAKPNAELEVLGSPAAAAKPAKDGRFTVGKPDVTPSQNLKTRPYWVGTLEGGPVHNWTAPGAGVRFVRAQGELTPDGEYKGLPGQVVYLTDVALAKTLESVRNHVVRWIGTGPERTGRIWPTDYYIYRASPNDESLGRYLFLYALDENAPQNRPVARPEPMVK